VLESKVEIDGEPALKNRRRAARSGHSGRSWRADPSGTSAARQVQARPHNPGYGSDQVGHLRRMLPGSVDHRGDEVIDLPIGRKLSFWSGRQGF